MVERRCEDGESSCLSMGPRGESRFGSSCSKRYIRFVVAERSRLAVCLAPL